jgi:hypothetical protein
MKHVPKKREKGMEKIKVMISYHIMSYHLRSLKRKEKR